MPRIHLVLNRCSRNRVPATFRDRLVSEVLSQMADNYRIAFPVFCDGPEPLRMVVLAARADDDRLRHIADCRPEAGAEIVVFVLAFESETAWFRQATSLITLFPEQPNMPEFVIAPD